MTLMDVIVRENELQLQWEVNWSIKNEYEREVNDIPQEALGKSTWELLVIREYPVQNIQRRGPATVGYIAWTMGEQRAYRPDYPITFSDHPESPLHLRLTYQTHHIYIR